MCPILHVPLLRLGRSFLISAISFYYDQRRPKHQPIFREDKPGKPALYSFFNVGHFI